MPREFVQTKANLISLLKEYAALGGGKIRLNLIETELYSDDARDAEKRFGIEPEAWSVTRPGPPDLRRRSILGVAFTSGLEEVVVPFFDRGLPVEYELTRSIRVVSRASARRSAS